MVIFLKIMKNYTNFNIFSSVYIVNLNFELDFLRSARRWKGFFQIGMIIKLSLGSTYPNTVPLDSIMYSLSDCPSVTLDNVFTCPFCKIGNNNLYQDNPFLQIL